MPIQCTCQKCGATFFRAPANVGPYCSQPCQGRYRPLADRFWEKVVKTDSCWVWRGATDPRGYGRIVVMDPDRKRTKFAHRVSWELAFGAPPANLFVLHHCDTPPCIRPDHLFLGTRNDNTADMVAKGRQASGDRSGQALHPERYWKHGIYVSSGWLTDTQVREIRQAYATGSITKTALARRYGVGIHTVMDILRGKRWRHVQ